MDLYPLNDLAADLGVSPGDVRVVLAAMGVAGDQLDAETCGAVRDLLDPHGERTEPALLYWPGAHHAPPAGRTGIGGSSATNWPDGPYPWPD